MATNDTSLDTHKSDLFQVNDFSGGVSHFALAPTFCKLVEKDARAFNKRTVDDDPAQFPWQSHLSDHRPREAYIVGLGWVVSFNVLNPFYTHWMSSKMQEIGGQMVDMSQRLSHTPLVDQTKQESRMAEIAAYVAEKVHKGRIVFLQEMTRRQYDMIVERYGLAKNPGHLHAFVNDDDSFKAPSLKDKHNFNCIFFSREWYTLEMHSNVPAPDMGIDDGFLRFVKVKSVAKGNHGMAFNLVNVHVGYGRNAQYAEFYKNVFPCEPTIVAGDFNCSARWPSRGIKAAQCESLPKVDSDHLTMHYGDPMFIFFYDPQQSAVSAVNRAENVAPLDGENRAQCMADCFDYIMGVNVYSKEALEMIQMNKN